ncbi:hypothetical protein V6N11_059570 [Hibiscus sabdariffa]|uniref:Uncharacterized protein n=1 Tax=Hibiscus sabdariffa TaxID=183260 RepID=A0ABR2NPE0_9ROSI
MAGKHAPISTDMLPKEQPSFKRRGIDEANPEKSTTDLEELERKKRGVEILSTESTCNKGGQTKHNPRTEEGGKEKRKPK